MNLFELFVKIGVDDQASDKLKDIGGKLGNGLKTAAKIGTAAVGIAAAGITALTTAAVKNYAEYEQLVGGAKLMFGKAYDTVAKNAQDAYKTVQMSQNEYLQQVNGFATGLKTALGGNEQAAAELAHNIVKAEADIVAATGNTAENVQNAFNGIMRSNFTMLDNLQIGITPTKEGFQEVIDKVNEWNKTNGEATNYQMGNLADMQSALVDYIDMVGMSGYAQREASETITGSLSSMKAAWSNLVTGFADDGADLDKLIGNLIDSVVGYTDESGEQVKGVLDNLLPVIEKSLVGIAKLIEGAAPKIIKILPGLLKQIGQSLISAAPVLIKAAKQLISDLASYLIDNGGELLQTGIDLVGYLWNGMIDSLPALEETANDLLDSLILSIENDLPRLIDQGVDAVVNFANGLFDGAPAATDSIGNILNKLLEAILKALPSLAQGGFDLIVGLASGIIRNLPAMAQSAGRMISGFLATIGKNLPQILQKGMELVGQLIAGAIRAIPKIPGAVLRIAKSFISGFKSQNWGAIGSNIISGLIAGLRNGLSRVASAARDVARSAFNAAKNFLGIHSPSRLFRDRIGAQIDEGMAQGILLKEDSVTRAMRDLSENSLNMTKVTTNVTGRQKASDESGLLTVLLLILEELKLGHNIVLNGREVGRVVKEYA